MTGYLLGATRDADTLGQMDGYDVTVGDEAASRQGAALDDSTIIVSWA